VSWLRLGAVDDKLEWVANTLGVTFADPNSWLDDWNFNRDGLHINGRGARHLGHLYSRVCGIGGGRQKTRIEWLSWRQGFPARGHLERRGDIDTGARDGGLDKRRVTGRQQNRRGRRQKVQQRRNVERRQWGTHQRANLWFCCR
jgi:hypothetical protein